MKILKFCRYKSGLWEDVILENNFGKHYTTDGIGVWEESEKWLEGSDIMHMIDIPRLCHCLEQHHCQEDLLGQLLEHSAQKV